MRPVDHRLAVEEHMAFVRTLTDQGVEIIVEDSDPEGILDAIFSYDPSIMTNRNATLF